MSDETPVDLARRAAAKANEIERNAAFEGFGHTVDLLRECVRALTQGPHQGSSPLRVHRNADGSLDEVVCGAAHLEKLDDALWCLIVNDRSGTRLNVSIVGNCWIVEPVTLECPRRPDADLFPDPHPGITPEHIYEIFGAGWNHGRYTKYETVEELASGYSDAARAYAAKYLAQAHGNPRLFFAFAGKAVDVPGQFPTPGAILEVTEPIDRGLNLAAAICEKRAESLPPTEANEALKCAEAIRSYLSESHGAAQAETEGGVE